VLHIVVLVRLVFQLVVEVRLMQLLPEGIQRLRVLKDQPASGHIIHPREAHAWKTHELVKDRAPTLVPLGNNDLFAACAVPQNRLKRIQHGTVCSAPSINDLQILRAWVATTYGIPSPVDALLRAPRKLGAIYCCGRHERIPTYDPIQPRAVERPRPRRSQSARITEIWIGHVLDSTSCI
jgi:hypothetical protein